MGWGGSIDGCAGVQFGNISNVKSGVIKKIFQRRKVMVEADVRG